MSFSLLWFSQGFYSNSVVFTRNKFVCKQTWRLFVCKDPIIQTYNQFRPYQLMKQDHTIYANQDNGHFPAYRNWEWLEKAPSYFDMMARNNFPRKHVILNDQCQQGRIQCTLFVSLFLDKSFFKCIQTREVKTVQTVSLLNISYFHHITYVIFHIIFIGNIYTRGFCIPYSVKVNFKHLNTIIASQIN